MTEKRKLPRFHITPCQFHSTTANGNKIDKNFSVQDISMGGLSLRLVDRADLVHFSVGTEHRGVIRLDGAKVECAFRVRHLRGLTVGGEWEKPSAELVTKLNLSLDPRHLGQTLKNYPVPDSPNLKWYHTPVGVDLLLYGADGASAKGATGLARWILYFHQTFLQWERDSGLKSGQTLAEDDEGYAHGIVRLETRLLEQDATVDRKLLETARDFIESAMVLEPGARTLMKHQIEGNL